VRRGQASAGVLREAAPRDVRASSAGWATDSSGVELTRFSIDPPLCRGLTWLRKRIQQPATFRREARPPVSLLVRLDRADAQDVGLSQDLQAKLLSRGALLSTGTGRLRRRQAAAMVVASSTRVWSVAR
jgi:hypothetical protein